MTEINSNQRASLRLPKFTADFATVRDALDHWHKLEPSDKESAVLSLQDGLVFQPSEVAALKV